MENLSPERIKYHEILSSFSVMVEPKSIVYDIGKSEVHNYAGLFKEYTFKTIDRDVWKKPDILIDIETLTEENAPKYVDLAGGLLCNGVIEQCDDPYRMLRACRALLKPGGVALFGMCLLGYPPHSIDWFRFTEAGALKALMACGFKVESHSIVCREDVPSYIYAFCRKVQS